MSKWRLCPIAGMLLASACQLAGAGTATLYYFTGWNPAYMHHNASGSWTNPPGDKMDAACPNWVSKTVDLGSASTFQAVFTNGSNVWDNPGMEAGKNYVIGSGVHRLKDGQLQANAGNPCGTGGDNKTIVFYKPNSSWTNTRIHYGINGSWTTPPGEEMAAACTGWQKKEIRLGDAIGMEVTFNNGSGTWDNNGGRNYALGLGTVKVESGAVSAGDPCQAIEDKTAPSVPTGLVVDALTANSATIAWKASTDNPGGSGVAAYDVYRDGKLLKPGITATRYSDTGLVAATRYQYTVTAKDKAGNVSAQSTALSLTPEDDKTPPTAPSNLSGKAQGTTVTLNWTASQDANGIQSYAITRTGNGQTLTFSSPTNRYVDNSGKASTEYSYSVTARDPSGNVSPRSRTASVTTGEDISPSSSFSWDNATVYFLITDRFKNGDPSNDRSYGRESDQQGRPFNNDIKAFPGTFHGGDLKGLTQKINEGYFNDLGINAIWFSAPYEQFHGFVDGGGFKHYAYHGYYAMDYTAIDKNMGSKEDLKAMVDAAHAKGIRVIMDIVLNHPGYETLKDMSEYGFGGLRSGWEGTAFKSDNSVNHDNDVKPFLDTSSGNWSQWWGADWLRVNNGLNGYNACQGTDGLTGCVGFLPDFRTDNGSSVGIPPMLVNKWTREGRLEAEKASLDAWFARTGRPRIVPNYLVKWLTDYVREYGIDGFRSDTVKHVELNHWKTLKEEAERARKEWLAANPAKAAALKGDTDFWMTGEYWNHGTDRSAYFDNGFDSMINFNFKGAAGNINGIDNTYQTLVAVNADHTKPYNLLSYISSHDVGLFDRNNLKNGLTGLLLAPGGVQMFYGDESKRPNLDCCRDHAWRGDMNWDSMDTALLAHAQKLGKFRNAHVAVGAGSHQKLSDSPYTFARVKDSDKVVVAFGASGSVQINVGSIFADGDEVRDAYTNTKATVSGGKVTLTTDASGVVLLEAAAPANDDDTIAPSKPTHLFPGPLTEDSITFVWRASTDNIGVASYEIYRDGEHVGSSTRPVYTDRAGLTANTRYTYRVLAKDAAGNESEKSATLGVSTGGTLPGDVTPPSVPLNPLAKADKTTITLSWTASTDDRAVKGYELTRSGGAQGTKILTASSNGYSDTNLDAETVYSYTIKAFDAAGNKSAQSATASAKTGAKVIGEDGFYQTNPNGQRGKAKSIVVDGLASEWTEDMIIAQGVANDDPRIFRGSHEGPVYDLYALSAAWDDSNLYLMWQFTNVTDIVDPAQGYPISDNGKPYQGDIPQSIAFDVDPTKGADGLIDGTTSGIWGIRNSFGNKEVDRVAMFSSKPGVGAPAVFKLNANGKFDYAAANVLGFKAGGIEFKHGDGFVSSKLRGIKNNGWAGYKPEDLANTASYIDFLTTAHDKKQDTIYEIKIPFAALGVTRSALETRGIGVMLISTFGQSGIGSLPQDPAVLDNATKPYSADESTSKEKEDTDVFTVPFARIGK